MSQAYLEKDLMPNFIENYSRPIGVASSLVFDFIKKNNYIPIYINQGLGTGSWKKCGSFI